MYKAYEAYGDCRAGEFAHWGRLQCESGLRLHDDCRGKYRQHDESACVVVTYNTLQCTDEGMALLECDVLGKNFLACLDEPGSTVSGCKRTRELDLECLKQAVVDQRCRERLEG